MKNYIKLTVVFLISLITIAGCASKAQISMFDDESKITSEEDSYSYLNSHDRSEENKIDSKFNSFSGTHTVRKIITDKEIDVVFNFDSVINAGEFKVVLTTPDDEIINIVYGTNEGSEIVSLKQGTSKIKFVGKKANGEVEINIDAEDEVEIKKVD